MNIVIMRHGQAEAYASSDEARCLTSRGQADALAAGRTLAALDVVFDAVWVSPFQRAQQTADQVLKSIEVGERETISAITPESPPEQFIAQLNEAGCDNLLLVSHNPFVSSLIGLLCDGAGMYGPPMSPASMAMLTADDVLPGCCDLHWLRHAPLFEQVK